MRAPQLVPSAHTDYKLFIIPAEGRRIAGETHTDHSSPCPLRGAVARVPQGPRACEPLVRLPSRVVQFGLPLPFFVPSTCSLASPANAST